MVKKRAWTATLVVFFGAEKKAVGLERRAGEFK